MFNRNVFQKSFPQRKGDMKQQFEQFRKEFPCEDPFAEIQRMVDDHIIPQQVADFALACARGDPLKNRGRRM